MTFVNQAKAKHLKILKDAHYEFPRTHRLNEAVEWAFTDYFVNAEIRQETGKGFEARALLVVGPSRVGKSVEVDQIRYELDRCKLSMPDGRPAKMVKVTLRGISSWKSLGTHTLSELGFNSRSSSNQSQIWDLVAFHAQAHGVVCIHYDECQHIFSGKSVDVQDNLIDCFKSLLKQPAWPLMLVFSGVQQLKEFILREEQLRYLVRTVTFNEIDPFCEEDLIELNKLCFAYADRVSVDFSEISNSDFHQRLSYSCADRWGLVIELLIEALTLAKTENQRMIEKRHFCRAFTDRFELKPNHSPFSVEQYEEFFRREAILEMWLRDQD